MVFCGMELYAAYLPKVIATYSKACYYLPVRSWGQTSVQLVLSSPSFYLYYINI